MNLAEKQVASASDKATLSSVKKEMAIPRVAKSARKGPNSRCRAGTSVRSRTDRSDWIEENSCSSLGERSMRTFFWTLLLCVSFWQVAAFAQSSDNQRDVTICGPGYSVCDSATLTPSEARASAAAQHQRNFSGCMYAVGPCDHSELTPPEANAVAVAEHQHNVSNCGDGLGPCDHSKLTQREASGVAVAERRRNVADCNEGLESCDHSKLT